MNTESCRLCLKPDSWDSPLPFFKGTFCLPLKVMSLLGIEVKQNDLLPQVICHLCLAKITLLDEFSTKVKSSANLLNGLIGIKPSSSQVDTLNFTSTPINSTPVITRKDISKGECSFYSSDKSPNREPTTNVEESIAVKGVVISTENIRDVLPKKPKSRKVFKKTIKHCPKCKFTSTSEYAYKAHVNKTYKCPECSTAFCTLRGMKIHKANHSGKKPVKSITVNNMNNGKTVDTSNYNNAKNWNDNAEDENNGNLSTYQWCKLCDKVFLTEKGYKEHNETYHSSMEDEMNETSLPDNNKKDRFKKSSIRTPDKADDSVITSPNKNKKSENNNSATKDNSSRQPAKRKRDASSSLETFTCFKCKCNYESRDKLFVHTCIVSSVAKENEKNYEIYSSDGDDGDSRTKIVRTLSSDLLNDSGNEHNNTKTCKIESHNDKLITVDVTDSDDSSDLNNDNIQKIKPKHEASSYFAVEVKPYNQTINESYSGDNVVDGVEPSSLTKECITNVKGLKVCNKCGEGFVTMKELFHHKRSHRS